MSKQCCCGRHDLDEPLNMNGKIHEPIGAIGNFCGPESAHYIRDLRSQLTAALAERNHWKEEAARDQYNAAVSQEESAKLLAERDSWLAAHDAIYAECKELKAENANLRAAVRGRTMYHSDEDVMQELGEVRAERDEAREKWAAAEDRITIEAECCNRERARADLLAAQLDALKNSEPYRKGYDDGANSQRGFYNDYYSPEHVGKLIDAAWQQGAEAFRAAAEVAAQLEGEHSAPCWCIEPDEDGLGGATCDCCNFIENVKDRLRALPVPERKEG